MERLTYISRRSCLQRSRKSALVHPVGPGALLDLIGFDTLLTITQHLHAGLWESYTCRVKSLGQACWPARQGAATRIRGERGRRCTVRGSRRRGG